MRPMLRGGPPPALTPELRNQGASALQEDVDALALAEALSQVGGAQPGEVQTPPGPPAAALPEPPPEEGDVFDNFPRGGGSRSPLQPSPGAEAGGAPPGGGAPPPARPLGELPPDEPDLFGPPPGISRPAGGPASLGAGHTGTPGLEPAGSPVGRPLATRATTIVSGGDVIRLSKVDDRGRATYLDDYTAQEIGAAGDLTRFVREFLVGGYGGGTYRAEKHTTKPGVFIALGDIRVSGPSGEPSTTPRLGGGNMLEDTLNLVKLMEQQRKEGETAAREGAAQQQQQRDQLLAQFLGSAGQKKEGGGGGLSGMVETMMTMRVLDGMMGGGLFGAPPPPPSQGITAYDLQVMMQQQQQQQQQMMAQMADQMAASRLPPPLPPEAPPTDWATIIPATLTGVAALMAPVLQVLAARQDPLATLVPALIAPRQDPAIAVLTAKMDMLTQGGDQPDPLDQLDKLSAIVQRLTPRPETTANSWRVWEKAIDKGPEIVGSLGKAIREALTPPIPMVADPGTPKTASAPEAAQPAQGRMLPAPLLAMRDALLKVAKPEGGAADGPEHIVALLEALQEHLPLVARAGQPWQGIAEALFLAAGEANIDGVRSGLAALVHAAWGQDREAQVPFVRLLNAYRRPAIAPGMPPVAIVVANQIRQGQGRPLLDNDGRPVAQVPTVPVGGARSAPEGRPAQVRPVVVEEEEEEEEEIEEEGGEDDTGELPDDEE